MGAYMKCHKVFVVLVVSFTLMISAPPSTAKETLVQDISVRRDSAGGIIVVGKVKLPNKTKVWIELLRGDRLLGQDEVFVSGSSGFQGGPFTDKGKPYPAGNYKVKVLSHFTRAWQSADILSQVGEGGRLVPFAALIPDDPEFPKASRHLEETINVVFESLSQEQLAIEKVKNAKLKVAGKRPILSADPIKNVVEYFKSAGGFEPLKWSAKQDSSGVWIVTLDCIDGGKQKQAQWEFNPKTKTVKYLDPLAKLLSWLPSE